MKKALSIIFVVTLFSTVSAAEELTADVVMKEIIGKTGCAKGKNGPVCARHNPDGTSQVISGLPEQKGKWHFKGNKQCVSWEKIRGGKERCFGYSKDGDDYIAEGMGKITFEQ